MNFQPITREYNNDAHKALSRQREAYIEQSARFKDGSGPSFAECYAREQMQDHPSGDEVIAAGSWKYGLAQEAG